ncbi:fimbrial protein [Burkholderia sola]
MFTKIISRIDSSLRCIANAALICLGLLTAGLTVPGTAHAGCTVVPPRTAIVMLSGNINVPRDAPVGTELARFTWKTSKFQFASNCSRGSVLLSNSVTPVSGPGSNGIYPTNVAGVGVKIGLNDSSVSGDMVFPNSYSFNNTGPNSIIVWSNLTIFYSLVKTGPIEGGSVDQLPSAAMMLDGKSYLTIQGSGLAVVRASSCSTPDVQVNLGRSNLADLKNVGATSKAVAFDLKFNNCPAGLKTITYGFDSPSGFVNAAGGVIALSGSSGAKGVGIQLMDDAGKAVRLDQTHVVAPNVAGGSFAVPLQAALYRTSQVVTGGSFSASLTFTMSYH